MPDSALRLDWRRPGPVRAYVEAGFSVGAGLALALVVSRRLGLVDVSPILLLSVLVPAIRFGIWPAVFASGLAFLAYNFFFIEPLYTLAVARPRELVTLVAFLVVAVITSAVAGRSRQRAHEVVVRGLEMRQLYAFARRLSSVADRATVLATAADEASAILGRRTVFLLAEDDDLTLAAASSSATLDEAALAAARWAFACRELSGAGTATHAEASWIFAPMSAGHRRLGVIGVAAEGKGAPLDTEQVILLYSLAEHAAIAADRARLASEISVAKAAAETESVRNILLASVSHDFRTPLSSILGAASSLIDYGERLSAPQRADLLSSIHEEAEHLDGMVRNLLAITRLEAGALDLQRDWVDLADSVHRVVALARRRGASQSIRVQFAADMPLVRADASLIEQALGNVLGNSLRHAGAGAVIDLSIRREGQRALVAVTDDGPGIPADLLPRVFAKFARAKASAADGGESFGLGLAITQGIVEAHGGEVTAESPVADGHGCRITLRLPLEASHPEDSEDEQADPAGG
ncbi:sensor histidine kinase [Oryzibacter oryziterrae]|uniref:sensor histidine kinase n=1 Tax=Oryzibacter oryziterrae TaxID=2766474 RepID=UPI001F29C3EF|nr:ATP-binding protein [Oryzibacter oryziterrae]